MGAIILAVHDAVIVVIEFATETIDNDAGPGTPATVVYIRNTIVVVISVDSEDFGPAAKRELQTQRSDLIGQVIATFPGEPHPVFAANGNGTVTQFPPEA